MRAGSMKVWCIMSKSVREAVYIKITLPGSILTHSLTSKNEQTAHTRKRLRPIKFRLLPGFGVCFATVTVWQAAHAARCHRGHSASGICRNISGKRLRRFALFLRLPQPAAEIAQLALLLSGSKKVFADYSSEKTSNLTRQLDWKQECERNIQTSIFLLQSQYRSKSQITLSNLF